MLTPSPSDSPKIQSPNQSLIKETEGALEGRKVEDITSKPLSPIQKATNLAKALFATIFTLGLALLSKTVRELWKSSYTGFEEPKVIRDLTDRGDGSLNESQEATTKTKVANAFEQKINYQGNHSAQKLGLERRSDNDASVIDIYNNPSLIKSINVTQGSFYLLAEAAITKDPSSILIIDQSNQTIYSELAGRAITRAKVKNLDNIDDIYEKLPEWAKVDGSPACEAYNKK